MRVKRLAFLGHLPVAALLTAIQVAGAAGQSVELRGRAVDPQGAPMAGLEVLMHRVAGGSGANIARDTTAEDGSFTLTAEGPVQDSAVYFAAARYRNELFVGEFVRPPFDAGVSYTLVVGGQPFSLDSPLPVAPAAAPSAPAPRSSWLPLLAPVLALAGVIYAAATRSSRPPRHRRLLIRLAAFDEEAAAANSDGDGAPPDEAAQRERERIMEQLLSP